MRGELKKIFLPMAGIILIAAFFCMAGHQDKPLAPANTTAPSPVVEVAAYSDGMVSEGFLAVKNDLLKNENSLSHVYSHALGYAAVRENDPTFCGSNRICQDTFEINIIFRNFAEGKCGNLGGNIPGLVNLCENMDSCHDIEASQLRDVCSGLNEGDAYLVRHGMMEHDRKYNDDDDIVSVEDAHRNVAIYQGFKQGRSRQACEVFTASLDGKHAYLCHVMFTDAPIQEIIDGVVNDLAYFFLSITRKDKGFCEYILNEPVKQGCVSPKPEIYFEPEKTIVQPEGSFTVVRLTPYIGN